ncbi:MAG: ATP-dependent Clp protease ATP-binding subunit, partial [Bacteroidales bacterium]|nr:ATP-dependent Clp protease ATP-binding subunit [Bacteroidales bacterium]
DKAIDAMDEAGARKHISASILEANSSKEQRLAQIRSKKEQAVLDNDFKSASEYRLMEKAELANAEANNADNLQSATVDQNDIADVISMMTNIPVHRIAESESEKLLKMATVLKTKIIGQDDAVEKVVRAIQRNRAGLRNPDKPIGTFIFLGPTGVGKTQLAKKIAEYMFDSADNIIRIDMGEYMEKFSVSSLIGAPPGYVGYNEGGQLSERVRRKPYSVVLLDEIEKAHPDIFNILLQVLDEGRLTDSAGRRVDFKNTIVIMTSNVGSRQLKESGAGIGYKSMADDSQRRNKSIVDKELQKTFSPEFLNRIDDKILFNPLTKGDIDKIFDIEIEELSRRMQDMGMKLKIKKATRELVCTEGFDPELGARPLKRAIQKYI